MFKCVGIKPNIKVIINDELVELTYSAEPVAESFRRFGCILVTAEGGKTEISFARRAEARAGRSRDSGTFEQTREKVPRIAAGTAEPYIRAHPARLGRDTARAQRAPQNRDVFKIVSYCVAAGASAVRRERGCRGALDRICNAV